MECAISAMRLFASHLLPTLDRCRRLSHSHLVTSELPPKTPQHHPTYLKRPSITKIMTLLEIILMLLFTFAAAIAVHYTFPSFYVPVAKDILEHVKTTLLPRSSFMLETFTVKVAVTMRDSVPQVKEEHPGVKRITECDTNNQIGMTGGEVVAPLTFGGNAKIKHMHAPIWGTTASRCVPFPSPYVPVPPTPAVHPQATKVRGCFECRDILYADTTE
jgi:hypothetical protein